MTREVLKSGLSTKPDAAGEYPFCPEACIHKVAGKMFALIKVEHMPTPITLRCDPDHALKLRAVIPGYV